EALLHAAFNDVLEVDDAECLTVLRDDERRASAARNHLDGGADFFRDAAAVLLEKGRDGIGGTFANDASVEIDARHSSHRGEGNKLGLRLIELPPAQTIELFGENDNRATFG